MSFTELLGRSIGLKDLRSIDEIHPQFAAPWAHNSPFWVFFGCLLLAVAAFWFYMKLQPTGHRKARILLATVRAILLCFIFIILANPVLTLAYTSVPRPLLYVLFDGTESMSIEDEMSQEARDELAEAVGLNDTADDEDEKPASSETDEEKKLTRTEYLQTLLRHEEKNPLRKLAERYRLRLYMHDRPDGVRALKTGETGSEEIDWQQVAGQLDTAGQVTALGKALEDVALRHSTSHLGGIVVFSDFDQNSGIAPVGTKTAPAGKLGVPIYTVGVGPRATSDLVVSLSTRPVMKKAEQDTLTVILRQSQLEGRTARVKLTARAISGDMAMEGAAEEQLIGEQEVLLDSATTAVKFPYTPDETGRFQFKAEVEPYDEEVVKQNNVASREVNIRDDFLRLNYVAFEPTWEWRFIKEVFHRDKLVGLRGFRTFLRSSDPRVRRTNPLFTQTLTPPRSEFFANDVIFLDDMPANALSSTFCELIKEYVGKFGGGLVVIAGPRFGPGQLARTPLADILPVVVDSGAQLRDQREFRIQRTPEAARFDFMNLGDTPEENAKAWDLLGKLPWYQPVSRLHPLAVALAEHPTDMCVDGGTPQPLIAVRQYGKGEVIYLGFNETWRLRRKWGEKYYRRLWGQMIYRLGLRHALGTQKRFVVQTDRQQYRNDETVLLTVEAYDENFKPLQEDAIANRTLQGELFTPGTHGVGVEPQPISVPFSREGIFETRFRVLEGGEHRLRIRDPITQESSELTFQVTNLSAERQSAVRNVSLQRDISQTTGGRAYELTEVSRLAEEVQMEQIPPDVSTRVLALWSTWLCFAIIILLMVSEWLIRKWINLA